MYITKNIIGFHNKFAGGRLMEGLRMWFPLSISTERVSGGEFVYTLEAYKSVIDGIAEGIDIYNSLDDDAYTIGKTVGVNEEGNIEVEITANVFGNMIQSFGEDEFFVATAIDGDADEDSNGVMVVSSAKLLKIAIVPRFEISEMLERENNPSIIVVKESTIEG